MTKKEFKTTAFYEGQKMKFDDGELDFQIVSVDFIHGAFRISDPNGWIINANYKAVELLHPCPLKILREIRRRLRDSLGEGYPERLSPDILEQIDAVLGDDED